MVLNYFSSMAMTSDPDQSDENGAVEAIDRLGELACTNRALRRAARQLGHLYDEAIAPAGLKATQFSLLVQIDRSGGHDGPTLQALAERLAIRISAMTHALRPLVRDGLVELRPDAHDRRTKHALLTDAGRKRLEAASALWAAANHRVETVLGPDAAGMLRELADRVASEEFRQAYAAGRQLEAGPELP